MKINRGCSYPSSLALLVEASSYTVPLMRLSSSKFFLIIAEVLIQKE